MAILDLTVTGLAKFVLWCLCTALGYKLLDVLTPQLPFDKLAEDRPYLQVAILWLAGLAALAIVNSFRFGHLIP